MPTARASPGPPTPMSSWAPSASGCSDVARRRDRGPTIDGVLVVDKPAGMTSHDVVAAVRHMAGQRKVGHTGTLDPDATGVLVVCLGRATRLARFLQAGSKTYTATIVFGQATSTQDASGEVIAEADASGVTREQVAAALAGLTGDIEQVPPMVSAVKVDGERLHEKARRGEEVERAARPVTVHEFVLDDFQPGRRAEAGVTVICSGGTYVRTLAHDVGTQLGVGAHLSALRRTANSGFVVEEAETLDALERRAQDATFAQRVLPMVQAVRALPAVEVDAQTARAVVLGQPGPARGIEGPYALVHDRRLLAVALDEGERASYQAVFVRPDEVEVGSA
ncbi:MAG TPA: tRNA pseudouridine(55) synthase TruB [Nitriliruptorales bacterium]